MKSSIELMERDYRHNEKLNRREALTKAGCLALSVATMMILMKSQPAMAASAAQTELTKPNPSVN